MKDETGHTAIEIEALTKRFGMRWALNDIDFILPQGELLAVFGPNGAGKTTLIRILSTLMKPTSGRVAILGYNLEEDGQRLRRAVGVLTHQPLLFENLTAYENLKFYGQMFQVKDLKAKINALLYDVGLMEYGDQLVGTFSRGMQQRLAIARALIHQPSLLLMDEPHTGLDQNGILYLNETLKGLLNEGKTVVMTSHDFDKGLALCSKAAILNNGHLAYFGDPFKSERNFEFLYQRHVGQGEEIT